MPKLWLRVVLVLCCALCSALSASVAPTIAEANGIVASEVERAAVHGGWQSRTDIAGYSGSAFYYMNGSNAFNSPGNDLLEYPFVISTAGTYQVQVRGRIAFGTDTTEHNDCFVRLVDAGGTAMTPVANNNTATGTQWYKIYQSQKDTWVWNSANRDHDPKSVAWALAPGTYRLQISKRSQGHAVDRWVLWNRALHNLASTSTGTNANSTALNALNNSAEADGGTPGDGDGSVTITGERKQWHKVTLNLAGPLASETGTPNPFLDYRMTVTFSQGGLSYAVPGYFAADGNAGESSATSGTVWRAHLSPDTTGTWTYTVSFHTGSNVAINGGGSTVAPYHGKTGTFTVGATDKSGRDFRGKGRLEYVNARYLRHKGNGEWFLKAGADAPENFLNNTEIDGTLNNGGTDYRHTWAPHVSDWQSGDPTWKSGLGKGVIGAINYLSGTGCNVFSFLTMNITGDSNDVWPYIAANQRTRMDCSKLDQWEVIFAHGTHKGMYLHFKTQETENNNLLDGGNLGTERKVYYRELIARFGHHLALNWNLGEENTQSTTQRQAMAQYFYDTDPYRHNVVLHTYPGQQESVYRPLLGSASKLTGVSIQTSWSSVHSQTRQWIAESQASGKIWVVANDEQGSANDGIPPQAGWPGYGGGGPSRPNLRHQTLWGNLMAGGAGVEAYFGYSHPDSDLTCRNWRSRADWWAMCNHALAFFRTHLPFNAMTSQDPLVGNSSSANNGRYCFAQTGEVYAVYLPAGQVSGSSLNLSGQTGTFTVRWYDPRNGGGLLTGSIASITGGGTRDLGNAPNNGSLDWVVLVERSDGTPPANQAPQVNAGPNRSITMPNAATLSGTVSDDGLPAGSTLSVTWTKQSGPGTVTFANANSAATTATFGQAGSYVLRLTASDGTLSANDTMTVNVQAATDDGTVPGDGDDSNDGGGSEKCGFGAALALLAVLTLGLHRGLPTGTPSVGQDAVSPRAKTSPR